MVEGLEGEEAVPVDSALALDVLDPKIRSKFVSYFLEPPPHPLSAGLKAILVNEEKKRGKVRNGCLQ